MSALAESAAAELGDPRLPRLVLRLAGPAVVGISAHSLQMVANALFVAGLGPAAVASVALVQSMTLAVAALGYGIGIGTASVVSRALGRGDGRAAGEAAALGLALTLPAGALALALLLPDVEAALRLFGAPASVVATARAYAPLAVIATAVMLVHIVGGFIARAEASARFSMTVMVGAFGLNILLDALFILGWGWGIEGAGWATLVSQAAAAAAYALYFRTGSGLRLRLCLRRAAGIVREILAVGASATAAALLAALSLVLLIRAAAAEGEAAVAALGLALRILDFGMLPVLGLCSGAEAVLGFAHGAGDRARLDRALRLVLAMAAAYALAWSTVAILCARQLLAPLAPDAATLALAVRASNAIETAFPLWAVAAVVLTRFQATGAARRAAALSFAPQGCALPALLLVLAPAWGFEGVVASRALADAAACLLALLLLAAGRRRDA